MKKIIGLTGGYGNLGKKFRKLYDKQFKIINFNGNITSKKDLKIWLNSNNFNFIIHFAAIVPTRKVDSDYTKALNVNTVGTENLVDGILKYNKELDWFFYASTSHVYISKKNKIRENDIKKPISNYGKTKLFGENIIIKKLKNKKINFCIGRIFSIIDNNDTNFFLNSIKSKFKKNKQNLLLENLNHYRDFLSTNKICKIINILSKINYNGIINIGSGNKIYLKSIALKLSKKYNRKVKFKDNKNATYLIANISKLQKITKKKFKINLSQFL